MGQHSKCSLVGDRVNGSGVLVEETLYERDADIHALLLLEVLAKNELRLCIMDQDIIRNTVSHRA